MPPSPPAAERLALRRFARCCTSSELHGRKSMPFVPKITGSSLVVLLSFVPALAFADFCDLISGGAAPSCRSNAASMGATVVGNWLRLKPEMASQPNTGKKGKFASASTVSYELIGVKSPDRFKLTIDCFAGERSMRLQAIPYMLGLTNGRNTAFKLTFKIDEKTPFAESWVLNWQRSELEAPSGSRLAAGLSGAHDLVILTEGIVGNNSRVGYTYKVDGFDAANSAVCK